MHLELQLAGNGLVQSAPGGDAVDTQIGIETLVRRLHRLLGLVAQPLQKMLATIQGRPRQQRLPTVL